MASAVEVKIYIKGKALPSFISMSVQQNILTHHSFEIACRQDTFENFSSIGDTFVIEKAKDLIGKKVKIEISPIGKDSVKGKSVTIFTGIILEIEGTKYQDAMNGVINIRGTSLDAYLDHDRHCRSFEDMGLDDIVRQVLQDYSSNLFDKTEIASKTKGSLPYLVQYNETNLDFLTRLARTYGEWLLVTGINHFYFGEPPSAKASLLYGKDLHEFSFSMKTATLGFNYTGYNYYTEESIKKESKILQPKMDNYMKFTAAASDDIFSQDDDLYYNFPLSDKNADKEMEHAVKTDKRGRVSGINSCKGSSDDCELSLGCIVKIEGLTDSGKSAKTISYGEYRIVSLFHSCDDAGNYLNSFEALPVSIEIPPQTNTFLFPVCETQSAVVTDTDDPEGIGRIRVKFYWQDSKSQSPWLRVSTPYAGNNKGFFFIPEIGEEVLIGFENNNAEKPYVIGALYNGKNKPDDWKTSDNTKKGIRTQGGHTIIFNDSSGNEEITIYDTSNVNTITLSSHGKLLTIKCQGDIKIDAENINITANKDYTLDVKGQIKITSGKDTSLDAGGNCKITASQSVDVKASQNVEVQASQNVELNASASLKASGSSSAEISGATLTAKGSATAELSAGGQTVVKGGIVMIN
jgi:uncharacterized protein involved in type VI secretion and phage assembly